MTSSLITESLAINTPLSHLLAADLILEVESTMSHAAAAKHGKVPPYLHLLRPKNLAEKRAEAEEDSEDR